MFCCKCRQIRQQKNIISTKVVEFIFVPSGKQRGSQLTNVTSPKYSNIKFYNDRKAVQDILKNKNEEKGSLFKTEEYSNARKPSFLKNLKKNKDQPQ